MSEVQVPAAAAEEAAPKRSLGSAVRRLIADGAREWDLSERTIVAMVLVPIAIIIIGIITAVIGKGVYKWFVSEDHIAETGQAVAYFVALVLSVVVTLRLWRAERKGLAALYGLFCLALFFQIGEEISWGQRVFGWGTPETFSAVNKQSETNLHNVHGVGSTFKWVQMVVAGYGAIMALVLLRWKLPERRRITASFLVAPLTLFLYFAPLFLWRIYRNVTEPPARFYFTVEEYNEVMELCFALGIFLFVLFQIRRTSQRRLASSLDLSDAGVP